MAICPRADRWWIEAMFAETSAMPEDRRMGWLIGAAAVVRAAFSRTGSAAACRWARRWAAVVGAHFASGFGLGLTDIEVLTSTTTASSHSAGVTAAALAGAVLSGSTQRVPGYRARRNAA